MWDELVCKLVPMEIPGGLQGKLQQCDIELSFNVFDATCHGADNGSIEMTILTGTPPYTIDWDNDGVGDNDDPASLSQLAPGTYSVTVMDSGGCTGLGSFDIYEPDTFNLAATIQSPTAQNPNSGSINLSVTGGTLPYSFDWDNDGTGDNDDPEDIGNLSIGAYSVTVMDVNGCTATSTFLVEGQSCNMQLGAALASATCAGANNGKINLSVQGGTSPFTYDWNNDGVGDNDDAEDLHNLAPGTYAVTVTDGVGCSAQASYQVTQPSEIFITGNTGNATSIGGNDGWIDITVSGSTPPYLYDWSNDGTGDNNDTQDLSGLTAGTYSVKVTDSHSCTKTAEFTISQPAAFDLALRKTLATGQAPTVAPGGFVTFTITVFNQGGINASNILVIDYLPNHLSFMSSNNVGWNNFGAGPTWFIPSLAAGASISKNIKLKVSANAPFITIKNFAEITAADDNDPNTADPPTDIDSNPNAFLFDDPGGQPNSAADDVITGNGTGAPGSSNPLTDEDDHDGASIEINTPSVSLGNLVFKDLDNDGLYNNQDYGLEGVEVKLYDAGADFTAGTLDDVFKQSKITTAQGEYLFKGLQDGYYYVKLSGVGIPIGLVSSTGDGVFDMDGAGAFEPATGADFNIDNADDGTQAGAEVVSGLMHLTLGGEPSGNGDLNLTLDFGLYEPQSLGSIGDFIWQDLDFDGIQDAQEPGVQGVVIRLYDLGGNGTIGGGDDTHIDTELSNSDGFYSFTNILPGDYYLVFDANTFPLNLTPTQPYAGNGSNDSDVNSQGQTGVVSLSAGEADAAIDFGLRPLFGTIGNLVWLDTIFNGIQDGNEPGMLGISISLYGVGNNGQIGGGDDVLIGSKLTNINGQYFFDNLPPGSYYLSMDLSTLPNGYLPTTQDIGNDAADNDADATGKTGIITLAAGQTNMAVDFGLFLPTYDLSLDKKLAPNQSPMVDINDLVTYEITVTNQGNAPAYNIEVVDYVPNGLRFVQASNTGWGLLAPNAASYTIAGPINPGQSTTVEIKLAVQYGASGQSMQNTAEIIAAKDIQGIEIADLDSTPENGNPNEDDLSGTAIELIPHDPTGWIYCDKTGRIITGGTISVTGPNGIPNTQVNIIHNGSNGYYEFYTDGTPGVYTIAYSHPNGYPLSNDCSALPGPIDITGMPDPYVLGVDTISAGQLSDFTCGSNPYYLSFSIEPGDPVVYHNNLPLACTVISGRVTVDGNFNDQIDPADSPIAGATVYLFDCADLAMPISSTTTNASGQYIFSALSPGNYVVRLAPFAGYRFVSTGVIDQLGYSACLVLNWGDSNTAQNFGLYQCPTIDAGPDISHCYSASSSQLSANLSHGTGNFTWTPAAGLDNPTIENPIASPNATTNYMVNFDDGFGCTASDEIEIQVGTSVPFVTNAPYSNLAVQCPPLPSETPIFADFCDPSLTVVADTSYTPLACGYTRQITWTATNDENNSSSFVQILTVEDTQAPSLAASHPFFGAILDGDTLRADCSLIPSLDSLSFSTFDNCTVPPTITFTEVKVLGNCPVDGFMEVRDCGWTSTDACGNVGSLFFVVIITDNFDPVLSPAPADLTVSCGAIPAAATLTATDNCDTSMVVIFDEVPVFDINGCIMQLTRTWMVEDDCGNSDFATQTITVNDITAPTLNGVPADVLLACGAPIPAAPVVTATDACDSSVPVILSQTVNGNPAIGCFSLTRTWTATDDCGNTTSASQTITLLDSTPPVLVGVPADQNLDCSTPVPAAPVVTATDFCDSNVPVSFSETIGGNAGIGCYTITRTWSATDDCGNGTVAMQLITITDNTAPTLVGVPANLTLDCSSAVPAAAAVTATDFCDAVVPVNFVESTAGVPGAACRVITRTWTATDDCGNTATASQVITIQDNQAPVLSQTPANASYTCIADVPTAPSITATDNCDNVVPVIHFQAPLGNPAGCNFQLRRIWAASDDCGNSVVWTQTITVNDDEPPVFTSAIPVNTVVNCEVPLPAAPAITASDNCDTDVAVTLAESYFGDPASGCYILTRTWTATDNCGNIATASQDIMVRDNTAPNFVGLPNNATVSCDAIPGSSVTATDNCDATATVTYSDQILSSALGCVTQVVRTWVATDDCGNTRIASRTFTVQNTDAPTITIIEPLLLGVQDGDVLYMECDDLPSLTSASAVAAADCCGAANVTFHETANVGNCATDGYYAVMNCGWIATDCCGNVDSLFFTVYVIDNTPPSLVGVPADLVLPVGSVLPPPAAVYASDNCDHSLAINYSSTTTGPATNQSTVRTWSVTDDCGNTVTEQQTILITNDNLAPIISGVPADVTIEGPIGGITGGVNEVIVNDNLDIEPTLTYSEMRTGGNCCYVLTRRWTATDNFGNTTVAEQHINVVDTQAPVINGLVTDVTGTCSLGNVPMPQLSVTDNCTNNIALLFEADTTYLNCGQEVRRTWTATDECGNKSSVQQVILMEDTEGPAFTGQPVMEMELLASQNALAVGGASLQLGESITANAAWSIGNQTMPSLAQVATDNCTASNELRYKVTNLHSVNNGCGELWTVSFAVLDACGNEADETFKVVANFVDDKAPVLNNLPANLTVNCGSVPTPASVAASDETSSVQLNFSENLDAGNGWNCPGNIIRTWRATDGCGNEAIAQQTITVVDNQAPVLENTPANRFASCGNIPPVPTNITATDACAGPVPVIFSEVTNGGPDDCVYSIVRTWRATDDCGNSAIRQQHIWVSDNTPPAIAANLPLEITVPCDVPVPPAAALAVSDNCDDSPTVELVETIVQGGSDCQYELLRKWTVTDHCGNRAFVQQTVRVIDATHPILANVPANLTVPCGSIPLAATVSANDNCDSDVEVRFEETTLPGCPAQILRTWTAIDDCGNENSATQTITVVDHQGPILSPLPADMVVSCSDPLPSPFNMTAYDLCNNLTNSLVLSETTSPTACGQDIVRTWRATDACGNASTYSQLISVVDDKAPAANEPADLTVSCGQLPLANTPAFHDNCDANLSITFQEQRTPTACGEDVLRTWTATDNCGNNKTIDQLIHVTDEAAPALSFVNPSLLGLTDGDTLLLPCDNELIFDKSDVVAIDNCSTTTTEMKLSSFSYGNCASDGHLAAAKFQWTATDACGNLGSLTLNVVMVDDTAPILSPVTSSLVADCGEAAPDFTEPAVLGDCSEVTLSFATQTLPTAYGQNIVGTWTATDACGNAATAVQTIQVYNIGAAQLLGVPADLSIDLASGEAVPAIAPVSAIDNCSGEPLPIQFVERSQTIDACHRVIEREWSVVGLNGVTVSEVQVITVNDRVDFTATMTADSCNAGIGTILLSPATNDYTLTNALGTAIGTGTAQDGLIAGVYQVVATNANGCSTQSEIIVEAACNCLPASIKKMGANIVTCGETDGKAVITLNQAHGDYEFTWSPDLGVPSISGHARTKLPAGHYDIRIDYREVPNCSTTVSVDVEDDCTNCPVVFGQPETMLQAPPGPRDVCLPVPYSQSTAYQIEVDGNPYTGTLAACDPQAVKAYHYGGIAPATSYSVVWQQNGQTFHTWVNTMGELAAAMSQENPQGRWFVDSSTKQLVSLNPAGNYGQLTIRNNQTGSSHQLMPISTTSSAGTLLTLPSGRHTVTYTNPVTGCSEDLEMLLPESDETDKIKSNPSDGKTSVAINGLMTPNGDGRNDYLVVSGIENIADYELSIFNSLGQLMFRTKHYDNNWGGSWGQNNLPGGTYFYLLEDGKGGRFSGHIQIIR